MEASSDASENPQLHLNPERLAMNRPLLIRSLLTCLIAALASVPALADIAHGFDTDAQGWSVVNGGALIYKAAGGNPGGYLEITDTTGDDFLLLAPATWLGDGSAYLNGTFSFDAKNVNGDSPDWGPFGTVTISGPGGSVSLDIAADNQPGNDGQWHHYSSTLSTALWGASLPAVLANVTEITLKGEFHAGVTEVLGVDSIVVSQVPEPASAALMMIGMLGVVGVLRHGSRSN
jgi:hypothetical protein